MPGLHSEPVWLGDADAYELDTPAEVTSLDVHRIGEGPAVREVVLAEPTAGAATAPAIQPRSAWRARPPTQHPATTADLKLAIVHHTVSGNSYTAAQVPQLLRSVQAYHQDVEGYSGHRLQRRGRPVRPGMGGAGRRPHQRRRRGAPPGVQHREPRRRRPGRLPDGDPHQHHDRDGREGDRCGVRAALCSTPAFTVRYTSGGSAKYPKGRTVTLPRIVGHRDVQATDCPGGNLQASSRQHPAAWAAQLVPAYQAGLAPTVVAPDVTGDGLVDPLQYQPGRTADVQWQGSADPER